MLRISRAIATALVATVTIAMAAIVQAGTADESGRKQGNSDPVGIIAAGSGSTSLTIASDLAAVLDDPATLRILAVAGKGSVQNITDLLYLKGVDIAIVQADVLRHIRAHNLHGDIDERVHYITKLYTEELHVIARNEITTLAQLNGKTVNFGRQKTGSYVTATQIFSALGIAPQKTEFAPSQALEKLKAGEIDAMVLVTGKPANALLKAELGQGLRLLPVPFSGALQEHYIPAKLTAEDYPGLMVKGGSVETIAVDTVMAVFNWKDGTPRYKRVARFIDAFFAKFSELQDDPHHRKWREVNLNAKLTGWKRFVGASRWLERQFAVKPAKGDPQVKQLRKAFQTFLQTSNDAKGLSAPDREALFAQFLKWNRGGGQ